MWYRLEVRLTRADVGKRVVIRWRPGPADSKPMTDVLGILEQADAGSFTVRTRDGKLVVIPAGHAVAGKVVPPPPTRRRHPSPRPPLPAPPPTRPARLRRRIFGCTEHEEPNAHDAALALITEALAGPLTPAGGNAARRRWSRYLRHSGHAEDLPGRPGPRASQAGPVGTERARRRDRLRRT
jgi:hypothetical protein